MSQPCIHPSDNLTFYSLNLAEYNDCGAINNSAVVFATCSACRQEIDFDDVQVMQKLKRRFTKQYEGLPYTSELQEKPLFEMLSHLLTQRQKAELTKAWAAEAIAHEVFHP